MEQIVKKDVAKNVILNYPINKRKVTDQKSISHKLDLDEDKAFITAKSDIITSIDDNTLFVETLICETLNSLIVTSELPKLYTDIINIDITSQKITLIGEANKKFDIFKNDNHPKRLNKSIFLPKTVAPGKALAEFKNDILTIKLPKAEIEKVQKFYCKSSKTSEFSLLNI